MTISPLRYSPTPYANYKTGVKKEVEADSREEKDAITELQARDAEVRAHEAAHISAGGSAAGVANFEYQQGPDGKLYAVGGEVSIDISTDGDPKTTQAKMQRVLAAALAPANPSPQDIKVATTAAMLMMRASFDEMKERSAEANVNLKKMGIEKYEEMQKLA
ncbi:MAG TPA: putative metalloprotease CJM1_0395 family protein [Campylobacterales bacterium]|nr:putative metalloprotease CJM1_0395 family protein [Campylobacterales bacterium]